MYKAQKKMYRMYCECACLANFYSILFSISLYLVFDDLPKSQVEIHLTFAKKLEVAAAATRLSLALNSVGQLQLYQACLKAYCSH